MSEFNKDDVGKFTESTKAASYYIITPTGKGKPFYWPVADSIGISVSHAWSQSDTFISAWGQKANAAKQLFGNFSKFIGKKIDPVPNSGVWGSAGMVYQTPKPLTLPVSTKLISMDGTQVRTTIERFKGLQAPKADIAGSVDGASGAGGFVYSKPSLFKIKIVTADNKVLFKCADNFYMMCMDLRVTYNAPFYADSGDPVFADVQATFQSTLPAFNNMYYFK